jgi:hypothetical protein
MIKVTAHTYPPVVRSAALTETLTQGGIFQHARDRIGKLPRIALLHE